MTDNKDLVLKAHLRLFDKRDITVLNEFHPDFIEHSPLVAGDAEGLALLVQEAGDALTYTNSRVLGNGDLVALHGRFTGLDETDLVGFDLYRVEEGKIIEHWDGLVPIAEANASGRTQLDGPVDTSGDFDIEKNRDYITTFFTESLIEGDYEGFRRHTDGENFLQHSPDIADGVDSVIDFLGKLRDDGEGLVYDRIHRTIADGPFVLTQSEGSIAGERHAYYELWRMEDGTLAEMWDAITAVPADSDAVHDNGIF